MPYEQVLPPIEKPKKTRLPWGINKTRPLTAKEIEEILETAPVNIGDVASPSDSLAVHSRRFRASKRARLIKVQQMGITQQNEYYRKQGYF